MNEVPVDIQALWVTRTVTTSWAIMIVLVVLALFVRKRLSADSPGGVQLLVEMLTEKLAGLIRDVIRSDPAPYMPLAQTIFVLIFVANLTGMIPGGFAPSADIAFTAALAVIVFFSVPYYGVKAKGFRGYFGQYLKPSPVMLPFTIIGEVTRTLSLAVRLFGNMMSGQFLLGIIISVVATLILRNYMLALPVGIAGLGLMLFISVLSVITAIIQPLIFTVLALVYIAAAVERQKISRQPTQSLQGETDGP